MGKIETHKEQWFFETPDGFRIPVEVTSDREEISEYLEFWRSSAAPRAAFVDGVEMHDGGSPEEIAPGVFLIRALVYRDRESSRIAADRISADWRREVASRLESRPEEDQVHSRA